MSPRWIFTFGLLTGCVLADVTHPARQAEAACTTDAECEAKCLRHLPSNTPESECEVGL